MGIKTVYYMRADKRAVSGLKLKLCVVDARRHMSALHYDKLNLAVQVKVLPHIFGGVGYYAVGNSSLAPVLISEIQ